MGFVNFHVHSEYSFLASLIKVELLAGLCSYNGYKGCALTDTLSTFGYYQLTKFCEHYGIKPIYGIELFFKGVNGHGVYPIILIAINRIGLKNIFTLNSLSHAQYYKSKHYSLPLDYLHHFNNGIAALIESEIYFHRDKEDKLKKIIDFYKNCFGDNFFIEVNYCGNKKIQILKDLVSIIQKFNLNGIATKEVRYFSEDKEAFYYLNLFREKTYKNNEKGLPLDTEYDYSFFSSQEIIDTFKNHKDYVENSKLLFDRIDVKFNLKLFKIPKIKNKNYKLKEICYKRLKLLNKDEKYYKRLEYELKVIDEFKLTNYFILVYEITKLLRKNKIPYGWGRGSVVSSLVAYLLGITKIDPIDYNLMFERFLHPGRKILPDIDIDVCWRRRKFVLNLLKQKFGEKNIVLIATIDRLMIRSVIKEISNVYKISKEKLNKIKEILFTNYNLQHNDNIIFTNNYFNDDIEIKNFINIIKRILGLAGHSSVHASGIIIIPNEINNYASTEISRNGEIVAQITKDDLEDTGIVKIDLLGLKFITIIYEVMIKKKIKNIDCNDQLAWELISKGDTTGVFQLESGGMKDLLKKIKPENISQLSDIIALYRPGPIQAGMLDLYIKRIKNQDNYLNNTLNIIKDTQGMFIYQEQILQLAHDVAGMSWNMADNLRKALSSKDKQLILTLKDEFIKSCLKRNIKKELAEKWFNTIMDFGSYCFNKSHSVAYAYTSYFGSYLKSHYPLEFYISLLNNHLDDISLLNKYLLDLHYHKISVLPPDINKSQLYFVQESSCIRSPLLVIKNLGLKLCVNILKERKLNGQYNDIIDFYVRNKNNINIKAIENLILVGAFDFLNIQRTILLAILPEIINYFSKKKDNSQEELFPTENKIPDINYFINLYINKFNRLFESIEDKNKMELKATGIFLTFHPLDYYKNYIDNYSHNNIDDIDKIDKGVFICYIYKVRIVKTRNNMTLVNGELLDYTGSAEFIIYSDVYNKFKNIITEGKVYLIKGDIKNNRIIIYEIYLFEKIVNNL